MKNRYTFQLRAFVIICLLFLFSDTVFAQVGIGTTNPDTNAMLDISSTDKGVLLPRVNITDLAGIAPLTGGTEGMLVYNTNTTTGPGFVYWDGTSWVAISDGNGTEAWNRIGNAGTTAGTNFIGTTDANALRVKTNNSDQFEYTTNGRLRSFNNGNAGQPTYSWNENVGTGMFQQAANVLGFSTNAIERMRLSTTETVFNDVSNNYDFRIESDGQDDMFFIDASTNRIGIQTTTPAYNFHMLNSGDVGDSTAMAVFINTGTNGVALSAENSGVNGYNAIEGVTDYNGTTYTTAGVFGLAIENAGWGVGVRGVSNSSDGYGVLGTVPITGTWNGFGGIFFGSLGYLNGLYNLSDERAKKNIVKISSALENIMKIEGVSYSYDMKKFNPKTSEDSNSYYGFLAQNVKEFLPFAVTEKRVPFINALTENASSSEDHSQILNVVDYTAIVPVLVEAMKEQQAQIIALQEEIKILKRKN